MGFDAWLQQEGAALPAWSVLGRTIRGVVSWNVNDTCNYRCGYCTQRFMESRTFTQKALDRTIESFGQLPGSWEIKLSGGEPFQQPGLDVLAAGLVRQGHILSIQTNFSASRARVNSFLDATAGALNLFSASLHLDYATADDFLERARWLAPALARGARFNVTSVGTPERLEELEQRVAPRFAEAGIAFKVQPEKVRGYVRDYTPDQQAALLRLGGHNRTGAIANDFQGQLCHAGMQYLVIRSDGQAFRCYPAKRVGGRYAHLGSLQQGLKLLDRARVCPYTYCNCTVPIERGMMRPRTCS